MTEGFYGGGYDDPTTEQAYQSESEAANDYYGASTQAELSGDSYGSYLLNEESIEEQAQANTDWQAYNGIGEYAPAEGTAEGYADPSMTEGYAAGGGTTEGYADPSAGDGYAGEESASEGYSDPYATGGYDSTAADAGGFETSGGDDIAQEYADYAGS